MPRRISAPRRSRQPGGDNPALQSKLARSRASRSRSAIWPRPMPEHSLESLYRQLEIPRSGTPMGYPVISGQAVLLIPSGTLPTATATQLSAGANPDADRDASAADSGADHTATPTATATPISSITFVSAGALFDSSSAVATVTVGVPSGVASGDVLITQILIYDGAASNVPSAPGGWTVIRHDNISRQRQPDDLVAVLPRRGRERTRQL